MNEQLKKATLKLAKSNLISMSELSKLCTLSDRDVAIKLDQIRRTRVENTVEKMIITTFLNRYNLEVMENGEEEEL